MRITGLRSPGPALLFAHIIVPHPPFVVDEQGRSTYKVGPVVYSDGDQYPGTEAARRLLTTRPMA